MDPVIVGVIGLIVLFILLFLGLPVGFGMAIVGLVGFWYLTPGDVALTKAVMTAFETVRSYDLATLPLFLVMAYVTFASGLSGDLYNLAAKWLGHLPGGIAIATVGACAGFAAVSSSSIASASTMGLVAIPEMKKYNYNPALSAGCVAAGGTMGSIIPPSGMFIIYGIMTETSIGKLFIGGIIPGLIEAILYMIVILALCTWKPGYGPPGPAFNLREKVIAFASCGEIIGLIILVLGGIIIGWFTPTEAGAVGAFGAILFSLLRKRINWQKIKQALWETMKTTGMIYCILIGAFIFMFFLSVTTIPFQLANFVAGLSLPPLGILAVILAIYLVLGCVMDAAAMMTLTIPIFFPIAMTLGFDPVWFGVIITAMFEIAMITPPIGMNVFVIAGIVKDVPIQTIYKGIFPFLIADVIRLAIYIFVPATVLFLPGLMMR
jgi:C4-dicarboxylate transporter, DctM subunit